MRLASYPSNMPRFSSPPTKPNGARFPARTSNVGRKLASLAGLLVAGGIPITPTAAQANPAQAATSAPLVFDKVTIVDVEQGKLVPDQRVVIAGNRIQTISGSAGALPPGAQVVDAQGKYLIPGLWDLHTHPRLLAHLFYPLFLANGVTGIRDAWSEVPLDTLIRWRQEILAGTRLGPPRQLLSGNALRQGDDIDSTEAQRIVDSLKAHGANFIKTYPFSFVLAAALRRAGLPFGGHAEGRSPLEISDSGIVIIDHPYSAEMNERCAGASASVARCQPVVEQFRRHNTWWAPTFVRLALCCVDGAAHVARIREFFVERTAQFWADSLPRGNWLRGADGATSSGARVPDSTGYLSLAQRVGLPILASTDAGMPAIRDITPGFALHAELTMYVAEGLTPLAALQAATLNPATMFHATDSLGTVAAGKLADLILLDANPLEDISNTTAIRAVVANGRYFDRAALDRVLADVRKAVTRGFTYWGETDTKTLDDLGLGQ